MTGMAVISQNAPRVGGPRANRFRDTVPGRLSSAPARIEPEPTFIYRASPSCSIARVSGSSLRAGSVHGPEQFTTRATSSLASQPPRWRSHTALASQAVIRAARTCN